MTNKKMFSENIATPKQPIERYTLEYWMERLERCGIAVDRQQVDAAKDKIEARLRPVSEHWQRGKQDD